LDFPIDGHLIVELESVEQLLSIHQAQVITYIKLTRAPIGPPINFNVKLLKIGMSRLPPSSQGIKKPIVNYQSSFQGGPRTISPAIRKTAHVEALHAQAFILNDGQGT
jgi:hypothetical protein